MNFSTFIKSTTFAAALIAGLSLASCNSSDDGDDVSNDGNSNAGTVTDNNGSKYRLTKAGNTTYSYDSEGKLSSVYANGETYNVSYNPFKLTHETSQEKDVIDNIRLNANGYITGARDVYDYKSGNSSEHEESNASFSYDGNGHLTRMTASSSGYEIYNGEKESFNGTRTITLTWNDGKLIKVTDEVAGDGADDDDNYTYEFTYSNATSNPLCQYTPNLLDVEVSIIQRLACIGYFGKGPSQLPSGCREYNSTCYYKYGLLSSGLVDWYSKSYDSSSSYTSKNYMVYSSVTGSSSKIIKSPFAEQSPKKTRRSMFGIRPAKNNAE